MDVIGLIDVLNVGLLADLDVNVGENGPPGVREIVEELLGWTKWIAGAAGIAGIFVIAIMMMIGRRNRSQMAADGMSALPWIVGGFILIGSASAFADWMLTTGECADFGTGDSGECDETAAEKKAAEDAKIEAAVAEALAEAEGGN